MVATLLGESGGSGEGSNNIKNEQELVRKYIVRCDSIYDEVDVAFTATGLPLPFSPFKSGSYARATKWDGKRLAPKSVEWELTYTYTTPENPDDADDDDDPLDWRPTIKQEWEDREEVIPGEFTSTRVPTLGMKNSAGQPFNPPPTTPYSCCSITLTMNTASFSVATANAAYLNTINSDTFLGYAARSLRCTGVSKKEERHNGVAYHVATVNLKFKPTWDVYLLDKGDYHIVDGHKVNFKSDTGEDIEGFLNGSGEETTTPTYLDAKRVYMQVAFSGMGFPTTESAYKFV